MKKQNKPVYYTSTREFDCKIDRRTETLYIKEFNCYILVDKINIDTPAKKAAHIAKYIELVNECRNKNRD